MMGRSQSSTPDPNILEDIMNAVARARVIVVLLSVVVIGSAALAADEKQEPKPLLDLRPIPSAPEPVGKLHAGLDWLRQRKVRAIWIGSALYDKFPGSEKTSGQVLADAGFNLIVRYTGVDRKNRSESPDMATLVPLDIKEGHRVGLKVMVKWQYGSTHQEPYRKYREAGGKLHELTCCPLDADYVERHIGRWALAAAKAGADGFTMDTEMYESDTTTYPGPCFCDDCFGTYLKTYCRDSKASFKEIAAEKRGEWIAANGAVEHYGRDQTARVERQYDTLRQRCQAVNPAFLFAYAPFLDSFAGLTRGLGTSNVPCLVFSEQEYTAGPKPQTFANVQRVRGDGLPALYISGHMLWYQTPEVLAENALISSLYGDGWWAWYGGALLTNVGTDHPDAFKSPYGRTKGTTAMDYHNRLAKMHARLEQLVAAPRKQWPKPAEVAAPPSMDVPRRKGPVAIDGRLGEPAWRGAATFELSLTRGADATTVATTVRACWDEEAVYVAYECQLPEGHKLTAPERGRDNAKMWQHDGIEIFLAPNRSTKRYAQIMVSALGDGCDLLVDVGGGTAKYGTPAWSTDVGAAASATDGRYVIEVRIPFKDLAPAPKPGDTWGANFYRFLPDCAAWSPTYGGFHSPARFGAVTFR